uniref:Sterol carrier protein 2b n=1 Tax=Sinocyclocheilus grahami TaxID=75366 RepID=A0A672T8L0_SINGR
MSFLYASFIPSSPRIQTVLTSSSSGLEGFKAHAVFQEISKKLHPVNTIKPRKQPVNHPFNNVLPLFFLDEKADCTIAMADSDLLDLMTGTMNPQTAFFQGKLKITGNMGMAMKLQNLQPGKAKL